MPRERRGTHRLEYEVPSGSSPSYDQLIIPTTLWSKRLEVFVHLMVPPVLPAEPTVGRQTLVWRPAADRFFLPREKKRKQ